MYGARVYDPFSASSRTPAGAGYMGFALGGVAGSVAGHSPTQRVRLLGRAATHAWIELIRLLRG